MSPIRGEILLLAATQPHPHPAVTLPLQTTLGMFRKPQYAHLASLQHSPYLAIWLSSLQVCSASCLFAMLMCLGCMFEMVRPRVVRGCTELSLQL